MARRAHQEEELPFVALMDTMTNVVGVLIIVLVMIGIGLARSVNKVLSELPPVTVEEHEKLKKEVEETKPQHDPAKVDEESAKLEKDLTKATEDLKTMEVSKEKQNIKIVDLDDLKEKLAERKKERDAKKTSMDKLLADLDKLKAQLDTTPVYVPPPATVVKLPNPRPMPDKAKVQHFLAAGNRLIFTNDDEFEKLVEQELKANESSLSLSHETVKGADGKPIMVRDKAGHLPPQRKIVFDAKKLVDHFARRRLGNRDLKVEVLPTASSPHIPIKLTPVPTTGGETIDQMKRIGSSYQTLLKKFKTDSKAVVWFHVYKDSIETYLAARDLADQLGVPVGWDLYDAPAFVRYLPPEYSVPFTPPAPPPPAAPGAVTIAPPKTALD